MSQRSICESYFISYKLLCNQFLKRVKIHTILQTKLINFNFNFKSIIHAYKEQITIPNIYIGINSKSIQDEKPKWKYDYFRLLSKRKYIIFFIKFYILYSQFVEIELNFSILTVKYIEGRQEYPLVTIKKIWWINDVTRQHENIPPFCAQKKIISYMHNI